MAGEGKMPKRRIIYILLLAGYIAVNLFFLTRFPFVHSDEPWLSGLSRNIYETGDYSVTEAFFDLKPRNPHAVKMLFHSIQIVFIRLLGYNVFNVRLISLLFSVLTLIMFFKLCRKIFQSENTALVCTALIAVEIQFIYASHFARQEIVVLFLMILGLNFFVKRIGVIKPLDNIILGLIIGLGIGIHPNSFIISLPFGFIYIYHILRTRNLRIRDLALYASTVGVFALVFVFLSFRFDPNFFSNYSQYGSEFEVFNPLTSKISELKYFYLRLYYGVSGTYYTPDIRFELIAFAIGFIAAVFKLFLLGRRDEDERIREVILAIIALNAGIALIGRFNQTSVVFQFPLFFILIVYLLKDLRVVVKWTAFSIMLLILSGSTIYNAAPYAENTYKTYIEEISKAVKQDDTVLANLNAEFYFANGRLYDYRNLAYLRENDMDFGQYINKNGIQYIIYPEEMDFIYENRPLWNGIYGNVYPYYEDMKNFLEADCEPVHQFTNRIYGMRISEYINTRDWKITIYKVR